MDPADHTLIVAAMVLLFGGFVTGVFMSVDRASEPEVPRSFRLAHQAAFMQAPLLLGVVVVLRLSSMTDGSMRPPPSSSTPRPCS